jgi:glycosyltransferase involved in cell wall biosynthesis
MTIFFMGVSLGHLRLRIPLIKDLLNQGHRIAIVAPDVDQNHPDYQGLDVTYYSIPFQNTGLNPFNDLQCVKALIKLIKKERPDIIMTYAIKPVLYGSLAAFFCKSARVFSTITGMGSLYTTDSFKNKCITFVTNTLYKIALRRNHNVFFQNDADRDFFINNHMANPSQAILLNGSGVDTDFFTYTPIPKEHIFLFIARLIKEKGLIEYIQACKVLKKKYPHVRFQILGGPSSNPSALPLREVISMCDQASIEYLGEHPSSLPFLKDCSVFVLPTFYREGIPVAGMEALAVGRPIIVTDIPGCRNLVKDGVNGYLVSPCDANSLTQAMEAIINTPHEELQRMGDLSRELAESVFDIRRVNEMIKTSLGFMV